MNTIETTDADTLFSNWPYRFQRYNDGPGDNFGSFFGISFGGGDTDLEDFLIALAVALENVNAELRTLYDERFLESATGVELEKLAAELSITRRHGESDDKLRLRANLARAAAASNGTASDIEELLRIAFGEKVSKITVAHQTGDPIIKFTIPQTMINDIPLDEAELESELRRAFPAGSDVNVTNGNTFEFGQSGTSGLGNGELI